MPLRCSIAISTLLTALLVVPSPIQAQSPEDLLVTPTRLVLEGRERAGHLDLLNRGATPATYRISFVQMEMTEAGRLEEVAEPGPDIRPSEPLVRFSPRQVRLQPGESQTVRVLLRKPADLESGEYRSHLALRAVPEDLGNSVEALRHEGEGFSVELMPIFGVAVPVIVRHGELTAEAELSGPTLEPPAEEDERPAVSFRIERRGERSLYGDVHVTHRDPDGRERRLAEIVGLAVYSPNAVREVRLPLTVPEDVSLAAGTLRITFAERRQDGARDRAAQTAVAEIPLG